MPLEESNSPMAPTFSSKLKSVNSFVGSTDSHRMSSESTQVSKKRELSHKVSDEFDNRNVDHNPENLIVYQREIERNCSEQCPTRKHFTVDIVDKYCQVHTAKNIDFATIISVKVLYPEAPCPYAIDADSYIVYKNFFHPLISELQNGAELVDNCKGLNFGDTDSVEELDLNADKEILRVMYCEIIVRRNLNDFNLAGCLRMDSKLAVRDILKAKCRELFASLSPVTIPNEWVRRLKIDEPYLFESRAMNHYPKGRLNMVYKDDMDCTIGGVINYDDHLQIILSTNNGKLGHIFHQTNKIFNSTVFSKTDFLKHQKYGYVTYSPQFIGTGFVIRIHIRMFFVCLMDDVENIYLKDIGLNFQNFDDPSKGLAIISNRRTLGVTEWEILQNMLEGFRRLFELDQELKNTCPNAIVDRTMPVESLSTLVAKIYSNETARTYTRKYLTDTLIRQYENIPTSFYGLFNHCIRANAFYPTSLFPKACDSDCYSAFSRFFNPIILESNHCRQFLHNSSPIYGVAAIENRYKFRHSLISGYRVRFSRNLEDYPFPMLMSSGERQEIENKLILAFEKFPDDVSGTYFNLEFITEADEFDFLKRLDLIPKPYDKIKRASWVYRDWPKNRGIFLAKKDIHHPNNVLIILVNEVDHFQVSCLDISGERLDFCYDRAVAAMKHLDDFLNNGYIKKPNYGYLSSIPQNVGCSMRVGAKIHLKYLGSDRLVFNEFCLLNNMNYRGNHGSGTSSVNNVFDVSLKLNLNYSEIQILMFFTQRLKDLILEERSFDHTIPKPLNFHHNVENFVPVFEKIITIETVPTTASSTETTTTDSDMEVETDKLISSTEIKKVSSVLKKSVHDSLR